jgi:hypothetical protein
MDDDNLLGFGDLFEVSELKEIKFTEGKTHLDVSCGILFHDDDLQARVAQYINKKLKMDKKVDISKVFHDNNIQKTSNKDQIKKKLLVNDVHQGIIGGFSSADSNFEYLKDLSINHKHSRITNHHRL